MVVLVSQCESVVGSGCNVHYVDFRVKSRQKNVRLDINFLVEFNKQVNILIESIIEDVINYSQFKFIDNQEFVCWIEKIKVKMQHIAEWAYLTLKQTWLLTKEINDALSVIKNVLEPVKLDIFDLIYKISENK